MKKYRDVRINTDIQPEDELNLDEEIDLEGEGEETESEVPVTAEE
mgnify:FL=1